MDSRKVLTISARDYVKSGSSKHANLELYDVFGVHVRDSDISGALSQLVKDAPEGTEAIVDLKVSCAITSADHRNDLASYVYSGTALVPKKDGEKN